MLAIDAQAGFCYGLNPTAGKIWELLETPTSLAALCEQLSQLYAVDAPTCRSDTAELLEEMRTAGLVQIRHAEPSS